PGDLKGPVLQKPVISDQQGWKVKRVIAPKCPLGIRHVWKKNCGIDRHNEQAENPRLRGRCRELWGALAHLAGPHLTEYTSIQRRLRHCGHELGRVTPNVSTNRTFARLIRRSDGSCGCSCLALDRSSNDRLDRSSNDRLVLVLHVFSGISAFYMVASDPVAFSFRHDLRVRFPRRVAQMSQPLRKPCANFRMHERKGWGLHMKKLLLAGTAVGGLALVETALAADLPVKAPPPMVAPAFTWTGWYLGGHVGGAAGQKEWDNFTGKLGDLFGGTTVSLTSLQHVVVTSAQVITVTITPTGTLTNHGVTTVHVPRAFDDTLTFTGT